MITKTKLATLILGATLFAAGLAEAHHSLIAEFDLDKPIVLKGTITKMEWTNPHGWIYVNVTNTKGQVENWAVETGGPANMENRGLKVADFAFGTEIIIRGYVSKVGGLRAGGWIITFPGRDPKKGETSFPLGR